MNLDLSYHYRSMELWSAKRPGGRRWRGRIDTRRRNAAGKVIGGHDSRFSDQKYIRRQAHQAERRLWKMLAWEKPARRAWAVYASTQSELNWKGT